MKINLQGAVHKTKKPNFLTRLTDRTATQGSTIRLSCTTLNTPDSTIKWLKDGTPLFTKPSDHTSTKYRTTVQNDISTLEISNATLGDSGQYTCTVQNPLGEISTTAAVKVYEEFEPAPFPPIFTRPIRDFYKYSEDELVLECRIRSQPPPKITWLKNSAPIKATSRFQITESKDGLCTLTIYNPEADDSGDYTCKAENPVSSTSLSHFVNFTERNQYVKNKMASEGASRSTRNLDVPKFHSGLKDTKFQIGSTIALQVELKGTPKEVKWLKNSEELSQTSTRIRSFEDSGVYTLLVTEASERETGIYTCRAYTKYGHVDSSAKIQVVPHGHTTGKPPEILNKPESMQTIFVEDDIIFTCRVTGEPRPKVTWLKGVKNITVTDRTMMEHSNDYYKFTLKKAVPADAGTYWIVAKNMFGSEKAFVTVQVSRE